VSYLYEPHLHTSFVSACAKSKGSQYIRRYKELGYSGVIVTDHFYNGNTSVPRDLPWKEWVNQFCRGYEEAKNEGERQGIDVFFGWEETFDVCDDYLVYGLDKQWLLEHPESRHWTRGEQYEAVHAAGGCVVQAHPFRQHDYIKRVILSTGCVDAVEVANATNFEQSYDALAMRYAHRLGLPITAGTDIHDAKNMADDMVFGVYLKEKINSIGDYVNIICNKNIDNLRFSKGRCDWHGDERVRLPVDVRDSNDQVTGKSWKDFV